MSTDGKLQIIHFDPHHFAGLLGEVEGIWEDVDVGRPLQLVPAVGGDVELDVISLQQCHFGLGVLLPEWKLLVGETNAGTDPAWQRVVLWQQESDFRRLANIYLVTLHYEPLQRKLLQVQL